MSAPPASDAGAPLTLAEFPRALIHFDGDAFFTSVEQALHPELQGRPLVTGQERGIIACASYEAKALGIKRGVPLWEARRRCPQLVVLPSDYETYSLYSQRMFAIARQFSPLVEEYSIDEGFADLTGMRRLQRCAYREIARRFQTAVREQLGLTVSVGLSLSKSLAKLASKYRKPRGLTAVAGRHIHLFLARTPLETVWGFGPNTVALLQRHGLRTALDYIRRPEDWAARLLGKVGRETWRELRGESVWPLQDQPQPPKTSISKCHSFPGPIREREGVYAKLVRNIESAFIKLRRHHLQTQALAIALRRQDFEEQALEARLNRPAATAQEALPLVRILFDRLYQPDTPYRATLAVLLELSPDRALQYDLFTDPLRLNQVREAGAALDHVNRAYGKHALAAGHTLFLREQPTGERTQLPWRKRELARGETARQRLHLPRWDLRV
ncbi:MAG: DNA polymerase IV [Candidatus Marinimicrobia bacterium]|nr:DNA polymerase IV [Candidatus Neomarinimicrobiota bacterium]